MKAVRSDPECWRRDAWALLVLTAAGGVLRFVDLGHPALWHDEALTYARVADGFSAMLAAVGDRGFAPLHSVVLWLIARVTRMTPAVLRCFSAATGVLMIPAMYALAREVAGRRIALMSATFTCVSAFMLAYSRDAKMYMPFWLAAVCTMAGFLRWCRVGGGRAWALWAVAATLMSALHGQAVVVLALLPVFLLVLGHWSGGRPVALAAGLAPSLGGLAVYYLMITPWVWLVRDHGWAAGGVGWVANRTAGHGGAALLLDTLSSFFLAFSWVDEPGGAGRIPPVLALTAAALLAAVLAVWALGVLCVLLTGAGPAAGRAPRPWRWALVLALWTIAPVYAVYALSVPGSLSPLHVLEVPVRLPWETVGCAAAALGVWLVARRRPDVDRAAAVAGQVLVVLLVAAWTWNVMTADTPGLPYDRIPSLPAGLLLAVLVAVAPCLVRRSRASASHLDPAATVRPLLIAGVLTTVCTLAYLLLRTLGGPSLWMPRYLGMVWPALVIAFFLAVERLPSRRLRQGVVALLLLANLAQGVARLTMSTEPPLDRVVRDVMRGQDPAGSVRVYTQPGWPKWGPPATGTVGDFAGKAYLFLYRGLPFTYAEFEERPAEDLALLRTNTDPALIGREVERAPGVREVVIWQTRESMGGSRQDAALVALGGGWRRVSDERFPVRVFWNWGHLYTYTRRAYERTGAPVPARP